MLNVIHLVGTADDAAIEFLREIILMPERIIRKMMSAPARDSSGATELPSVFRALESYTFEPERVARCDVPTLLLVGAEAAPQRREAVDALHQFLPRASKQFVVGLPHFAMFTNPGAFVEAVLRFVLDDPGRAG